MNPLELDSWGGTDYSELHDSPLDAVIRARYEGQLQFASVQYNMARAFSRCISSSCGHEATDDPSGCIMYALTTWDVAFRAAVASAAPVARFVNTALPLRVVESGPVPGPFSLGLVSGLLTMNPVVLLDIVLIGSRRYGAELGHEMCQAFWRATRAIDRIRLYPAQYGVDLRHIPQPSVIVEHPQRGGSDDSPHFSFAVAGNGKETHRVELKPCPLLFPSLWAIVNPDTRFDLPRQAMLHIVGGFESSATTTNRKELLLEYSDLGVATADELYELGTLEGLPDKRSSYFTQALRSGLSEATAVVSVANHFVGLGRNADAENAIDQLAPSECGDGSRISRILATLPDTKRNSNWTKSISSMRRSDYNVKFLGGADGIGGSAFLLTVSGKYILMDCGMYIGSRSKVFPLLERIPKLDLVFVSHAHIDHVGSLAKVHGMFPSAQILCTAETKHLLGFMLADTVKLKRRRQAPLGDFGRTVARFEERAVHEAIAAVRPAELGVSIAPFVDSDIRISLSRAGHIPGAACLEVRNRGVTLMYTGDFSCVDFHTVKGIGVDPQFAVDLLIAESTYGNQVHDNRADQESQMCEAVASILQRGGSVLIPAFALGRAQEVVAILRNGMETGRVPRAPIHVDGLAARITQSIDQVILAPENRSRSGFVKIHSPGRFDSDEITRTPCVVIASSGMLRGGPAVGYAKCILPNPRAAMMFVGFMDEDSPGARLAKLSKGSSLCLDGESVRVECDVLLYKLSAHAHQGEIVDLVKSLLPRSVALVHGGPKARKKLATVIQRALPYAIDVIIPRNGDSIDLLAKWRPADSDDEALSCDIV